MSSSAPGAVHPALCTFRCTYESRLLKYAMRGFAIAASPALLDRARLDPSSFDSSTLLFSSGHTGCVPHVPMSYRSVARAHAHSPLVRLRRLLVAERHAAARREASAGPAGAIAADGPAVSLSAAWGSHGQIYGGRTQGKGFLPGHTSFPRRELCYHGSCDKQLNFDEWFNLKESEEAKQSHNRPMYLQGTIPWRLGYDPTRIEE